MPLKTFGWRLMIACLHIAAATLGLGAVTGCVFAPEPRAESPADATLSASVQTIDASSGVVTLNGVDLRRPATPFRFEWGDGTSSQNFFPASHVYVNLKRNYLVKITAVYEDSSPQTITVPVLFRKR